MYCLRCGKELPVIARFCSSCGTAVPATTASPDPIAKPVARTEAQPSARAAVIARPGRAYPKARLVGLIAFCVFVPWFVIFKSGSPVLAGDSFEAAAGLWTGGFLLKLYRRSKYPTEAPIPGIAILAVGMLGALGIAGGGRLMMAAENRKAAADMKAITKWEANAIKEIGSGSPISRAPQAESHSGRFLVGFFGLLLETESEVARSKPIPIPEIVNNLNDGKRISVEGLNAQIEIRNRNLARYQSASAKMGDYTRHCEQSAAWEGWPRGWTREYCASFQSTLSVPPTAVNFVQSETAFLKHLAKLPRYSGAPTAAFDFEAWRHEYDRLAGLYNAAQSELPQEKRAARSDGVR